MTGNSEVIPTRLHKNVGSSTRADFACLRPQAREKGAEQYVQMKADVFRGRQTHPGKSQSPIASIACMEETKCMSRSTKPSTGW